MKADDLVEVSASRHAVMKRAASVPNRGARASGKGANRSSFRAKSLKLHPVSRTDTMSRNGTGDSRQEKADRRFGHFGNAAVHFDVTAIRRLGVGARATRVDPLSPLHPQ